MNINTLVDKSYESSSFKEIAEAPLDALQGLSQGDAEKLKTLFNISSIRELAQLKFVADFARTTFEGGAPHTSRDAEQLFLLRTQLAF